ncbi:DUF1127 domain-containing protein [Marinobacteraceae bacterium S3BR75-40.1]
MRYGKRDQTTAGRPMEGVAGERLLHRLGRWSAQWRVWQQQRHTLHQMEKLDDHLLEDLGVERERGPRLHARFAEPRARH